MKNEKTATKSEISFLKLLFSNKLFLTGVGGLLVFVLLSFVYLYNPRYVPTLFKSTADIVGDTIVGKDLAETIDATRDESGAASIRTIFNTNKEENLEKHCEKKEESGQVQEKCYKTYENEEFGYSVEIPIDWELYKTDTDSSSFANKNDVEQLKEDEIKYTDTDVPFTFGKIISIALMDNPEDLSLEEFAKNNLLSSESEGSIESRISKDNISGIYVLDKGPNRFGGGIGEYFLFNIDNKLFAIWLDHEMLTETKNEELSTIFEAMIESIKL